MNLLFGTKTKTSKIDPKHVRNLEVWNNTAQNGSGFIRVVETGEILYDSQTRKFDFFSSWDTYYLRKVNPDAVKFCGRDNKALDFSYVGDKQGLRISSNVRWDESHKDDFSIEPVTLSEVLGGKRRSLNIRTLKGEFFKLMLIDDYVGGENLNVAEFMHNIRSLENPDIADRADLIVSHATDGTRKRMPVSAIHDYRFRFEGKL